jgi:hypothetical protein
MRDPEFQRQIADDVYAITGLRLPETDPLIGAAIYYAATLRAAGKEASGQFEATLVEHRSLLSDTRVLLREGALRDKAIADDYEKRLVKVIGEAAKGQLKLPAAALSERVPLLVAFAAGAAACLFGIAAGCGFSFSWISGSSVSTVGVDVGPGASAEAAGARGKASAIACGGVACAALFLCYRDVHG